MPMLGPSFQIGRSALAAYQAAIATVGQNIANVGNPDYTRQSARLAPIVGGPIYGGVSPGAGVRFAALERHIDEAVESQLRSALSGRGSTQAAYQAMTRIEAVYNELGSDDLSSLLNGLFGSFATLQTTPDDATSRQLVLSAAQRVVDALHRQRDSLYDQVQDINRQVDAAADRAAAITRELASLNAEVVTQRARGQGASAPLEDRRDALLKELSAIMEIQVRAQDNGSANVYVGGEPLVEFDRSRGPIVERVFEGGIERAVPRFSDNNAPITLSGGSLAGLIEARDVHVVDQLDRLDQLALGVIWEVNRIQATGRGLIGYTDLTGSYAVLDPTAALNTPAAGLPFPVQNGTFLVHVRDAATGRTITRQIEVDLDGLGTDTSLDSLASALDSVPGLTASATADHRLRVTADAGSEFWVTEDSSDCMAALGVGVFFRGQDAADIEIHPDLDSDARRIAASLTGETGDGTNAGRFAALSETGSGLLSGKTLIEHHAAMVNDLAVNTASARTSGEATEAIYNALVAQREAVSGVSLDEEAINLTRYEKAYEGAARFVSVLDQLSEELLALVG